MREGSPVYKIKNINRVEMMTGDLPRKPKIVITTGTRPEIIKLSLLIKSLKENENFETVFIHSGQHYDKTMFSQFLQDLDIPIPEENFSVGSGSHINQLATMMEKYESLFLEFQPNLVIAQGDTNTVLASAITARKMDIPFAHVEAGIRSFDRDMPEEINRALTAVCAELHFAPTTLAVQNLLQSGIPSSKIFFTGNPVVDVLQHHLEIAQSKSKILEILQIPEEKNPNEKLILLTCHRPKNVDNRENLSKIISALRVIKGPNKIIFPIHPRTRRNISKFSLSSEFDMIDGMEPIEPLGYLDFIVLMKHSDLIITDSGGIQEEAFVLGIPCIVLRENTERPEILGTGISVLVGLDSRKIEECTNNFLRSHGVSMGRDENFYPFGKGDATIKMERIIEDFFSSKFNTKSISEQRVQWNSTPIYKLEKIPPDFDGKNFQDFVNTFPFQILSLYDEKGLMVVPKPDFKLSNCISFLYLQIQ